MEPSQLILAQTLSFSGLIGASGAYAGIIRRRQERRLEAEATAAAARTAVVRVDRSLALSRLDRTFTSSIYRRRDR